MAAVEPRPRWIYHERQQASLCGQHCLNNLLQGHYFEASDLAAIAAELDSRERALMMAAGTGALMMRWPPRWPWCSDQTWRARARGCRDD